jgi:predicted dithiol-disulfide oxidoreductase (DUF899 family)
MDYRNTTERLDDYRRQIQGLRQEMRKVQAEIQPQEVRDYRFRSAFSDVTLSALFGGRPDLFVIHNMGRSCSSCTMWADGFNGVYPHLADRAAFVVSSPDAPDVQQAFAASRGWRFPMVSHLDTDFAADMGYRNAEGRCMPGVSVFRRDGQRILRVSDTGFHPADDFCTVWRFLDLLPEGSAAWRPKFSYA